MITHSCLPLATLHTTKSLNENHSAQGLHKRHPGVAAIIKPPKKTLMPALPFNDPEVFILVLQ